MELFQVHTSLVGFCFLILNDDDLARCLGGSTSFFFQGRKLTVSPVISLHFFLCMEKRDPHFNLQTSKSHKDNSRIRENFKDEDHSKGHFGPAIFFFFFLLLVNVGWTYDVRRLINFCQHFFIIFYICYFTWCSQQVLVLFVHYYFFFFHLFIHSFYFFSFK